VLFRSAPGAVEAQPGLTTDKTPKDDDTTIWSNFVANIRRSKVDDLRRWCKAWSFDYSRWRDDETGDIVDIKGFKDMIVQETASRCGSAEKPLYPKDLYGFGWGYLPRTFEELDQSAESCACCMKVRRTLRAGGCDADNKFCATHAFGAVFIGKISFSENP
jgi:hypothetical protein